MGDGETPTPVGVESPVEYHPYRAGILTLMLCRGTVPDGQFDWGGYLLKSNGGVQRFPQHGRQSCVEHKSRREPDCATDKSSRRESGV